MPLESKEPPKLKEPPKPRRPRAPRKPKVPPKPKDIQTAQQSTPCSPTPESPWENAKRLQAAEIAAAERRKLAGLPDSYLDEHSFEFGDSFGPNTPKPSVPVSVSPLSPDAPCLGLQISEFVEQGERNHLLGLLSEFINGDTEMTVLEQADSALGICRVCLVVLQVVMRLYMLIRRI